MLKFNRPSSAPSSRKDTRRSKSTERNRKALRTEWEKLTSDHFNSSSLSKPQKKVNCRPVSAKGRISFKPEVVTSDDGFEEELTWPELPDLCGLCNKLVMTATKCTVLNESFHKNCLNCDDCGVNLLRNHFKRGEDKKFYCQQCHLQRFAKKCKKCEKALVGMALDVNSELYHPNCFKCDSCDVFLYHQQYKSQGGIFMCIGCYEEKVLSTCWHCAEKIRANSSDGLIEEVILGDRHFHRRCFICHECGTNLSDPKKSGGCFELDQYIFCKSCFLQTSDTVCQKSSL
ncbi:unnamed protein product [Oikopleura dioica]|uniref:LIM zinc-binding domain-containing protein n=1 Tax=Oikopleura dioica TaxID=34765 RepID=E4WTS2_OIKDI|nr:unnamed protein product [Oikopleura dioica]